MIRHEAEREPFLPGRQRRRSEDLAGAGNRRRLGDDDRLGGAEAAPWRASQFQSNCGASLISCARVIGL